MRPCAWQCVPMGKLVHINGIPGAGKSSVATLFAQASSLALVVEIDLLRTQLTDWRDRPESQLLARELALSLIRTHLDGGSDVVVPQFLGRSDFIECLGSAASDAGVVFVEVLLDVDVASAVERFRARRAQLASASHPEGDVADDEIEVVVQAASDSLAEVAATRPNMLRLDGSGPVERICADMIAALSPPA